ncbi:Imm50 family immunity protein [Allomesorhizobium alhagi]|jgi:hypothetical protein|uniref:Uncharacterized protein n=1 Tax=Mesorhizobium alhagi CCNWXJ12-2 TaxID=1107882 RepID=H0HL49_9HYPH|nr:hypothetical protein MAXJ12_04299 [Mesorhizobium alhagi CCNWXJ12-2]
MWPRRIENPTFLLSTYGHYPNLGDVAVTELNLDRSGPRLSLSLILTVLPYNPPPKWGLFNRVFLKLGFLDLSVCNIQHFGRIGVSSLRMWDNVDRIHIHCDGAVILSAQCGFLYVEKMSGLLVETPSSEN